MPVLKQAWIRTIAAEARCGNMCLRSGPAGTAVVVAIALLANSPLASGSAKAQDLRPGMGAARVAPAYDPTATVTGVGVGQPIDPSAIYTSPTGASANGATSRRSPRRASKPVKASTKATNATVRLPVRTGTGLPGDAPPAVQRAPRRVAEVDPYAAIGINLGGITLRPALTVSGGYDDNPNRAANSAKKGSSLLRTEGEINAQSDWSRHDFRAQVNGGYTRYFAVPDASRPDLTGRANLRVDITRDTAADAELRSSIDSQRPGSPDLNAAVVGRPLIYGYGASLGVSHRFDPLTISLRGTADRTSYEDAKLSSGATLTQKDRDLNQYGLKLRTTYEVTPGLKPFVEAAVDTRQFDQSVDVSGFKRSSNGLTGRAGASFELTRLLTGEASIGYQKRDYEDARLTNLRGLIGDASLVWTATELTTVTLRGTTDLLDTTIAGVNGSVARRAELQVAHALQRNLTLTGTAAYGQTDYNGIALKEDTLTLGAKLEWKLSRSLAVRASFTHERLKSTNPGSDYTANVYLMGLRMQL